VRSSSGRKAEANQQPAGGAAPGGTRADGTSHFGKYKSVRYTIRRSFTSEFDF
jgi:hypothetical protein